MNSIAIHHEIVVIGAGPVGALMALNLKQQGYDVLLIEARAQGSEINDKRTLALSYNSLQAFLEAGVPLSDAQLTPIHQVHVSQQNAFGRTALCQEDMNLPYLGQVVDYKNIVKSCETALDNTQVATRWQSPVVDVRTTEQMAMVTLQSGQTITCQWVILAEGGPLTAHLPNMRRHEYNYQQSAWVSTIHFKNKPQGVAYERFSDAGPMALLPYGDAYRLIWTRSHTDAKTLNTLPQDKLIQAFEASFGQRLGPIDAISDMASFPLVLKQMNQVYSQRVICIGNAAQTMHPVAAQGLNLGVRDAQALSKCFKQKDALYNSRLGKEYGLSRSLDAHSIVGFTHSLVTVFDQPSTTLRVGRGAVMAALDAIPFLRKKFTRHLIYGL